MLTFLTGFIFELPLIMVACMHLGLCTSRDFKSKRAYAIFFAFVIGGILTPPDPWTQVMLALPLILLYEIGVWLCWLVEKKKDRKIHDDQFRAEKTAVA